MDTFKLLAVVSDDTVFVIAGVGPKPTDLLGDSTEEKTEAFEPATVYKKIVAAIIEKSMTPAIRSRDQKVLSDMTKQPSHHLRPSRRKRAEAVASSSETVRVFAASLQAKLKNAPMT